MCMRIVPYIFFVCTQSVAALLRTNIVGAAYPYGGFPFGWWGIASQKTAECNGGTRKKSLCIDFGSSGAKFMDCTDENKILKWSEKFYDGAGAFDRMTRSVTLETDFQNYIARNLQKDEKNLGDYKLRMCGGTAGNRFARLHDKDKTGWDRFNNLLQKYCLDKGNCKTFAGTEEATFEWKLSNKADIFAGIGGASMQLRIPRKAVCPTLNKDLHFDGGVGAKEQADYCIKDEKNGQLWSFLADGTRADDSLHIVGGMDEVVKKIYKKTKSKLGELGAGPGSVEWMSACTALTVLSDPMWKAMLNVMYPTNTCKAIFDKDLAPENGGEKIVLLSGAERGRKEFVKKFVKKSKQTLHAASLVDSRQTLFHFLNLTEGRQDGMADKVFKQCKAAGEQYKFTTANQKQSETDFYTKFKDAGQNVNSGFLCMSNIFHYAWITSFAGYTTAQSGDVCKQNINKILGGATIDGDWMTGALKQ